MNTKSHWNLHPDILGRLTWMHLRFAEILAPHVKGKSVLDLGCGSGELSNFLASRGAYVVGIDFSSTLIDTAKSKFGQTDKLKFIEADVLNLNLNLQFDIICGRAILHEITHEDTPKLVDFFDGHLKTTGFGYFQENSFFNPLFRVVRSKLVGRYGIPKFGSDQETPFDRKRFKLYQNRFKYTQRSGEVFSLFRQLQGYLLQSKSSRVIESFDGLDMFITNLSLPDIIVRNTSYWQHIYFSKTIPKTKALRIK